MPRYPDTESCSRNPVIPVNVRLVCADNCAQPDQILVGSHGGRVILRVFVDRKSLKASLFSKLWNDASPPM